MSDVARRVAEVVANFQRELAAGDIGYHELATRIWKLLDECNVDEVVAALPEPHRLDLVQSLRSISKVKHPSELITIFGGIRVETDEQRRQREEDEALDKARDFAIARAWASRNPVSSDELAAAARKFVGAFDALFRDDWQNTRAHLGMQDEAAGRGAMLVATIFGEEPPAHEPHVFENEDIEDWGNRGALARARTEMLRAIAPPTAGTAPALKELLDRFDAVFHADWTYTRSELGISRFAGEESFLTAPESADWPRRTWLLHDYRNACDLLGRAGLKREG